MHEFTYDDGVLLLHEKGNKVIVKSYRDSGFTKSRIFPTVKYPLPPGPIKIFSAENTEEVTDQKFLDLVDRVPFSLGKCFSVSKHLSILAKHSGFSIETYVGWYFLDAGEPVFHCFTVLDGKHVVDLSDDSVLIDSIMRSDPYNRSKFIETKKWALSLKNSVRCKPLGKVFQNQFYISCPCHPDIGKRILNELLSRFPDHPAFSKVDSDGMTKTQRSIIDK